MELLDLRQAVGEALASQDPDAMAVVLEEVRSQMEDLRTAQRGPADKIGFREYVQEHFRAILTRAGMTSGRVAEIGGPANSFREHFPDYDWEFLSIFDTPDPAVHLADITNCPQIPDESYDVVFSVSVMEHVEKPWAAAREIRRILKPNGIVYHAAPFSYFFHGAPMDFWRYTPDALAAIFPDLEPLHRSFYGRNRRRNNLGSETNPVDQDGGPQFAPDAFGGWRENWFTIYAGRKTFKARREFQRRRMHQLAIDTVAALGGGDGVVGEAGEVLARLGFDRDGGVVLRSRPREARMSDGRIKYLWRHRQQLRLLPSPQQAAIAHLIRAHRTAEPGAGPRS